MATSRQLSDKRKLSGQRILARCEVIADTANPYAWDPVKTGYIVLNVRGGCLYLDDSGDARNIPNMFPHDGRGTFNSLTLSSDDGTHVMLERVRVAFQRTKKHADRNGIVFTFLDVSEALLDSLLEVIEQFPAIGTKEESSVPLEKVISLKTSDRLTLL